MGSWGGGGEGGEGGGEGGEEGRHNNPSLVFRPLVGDKCLYRGMLVQPVIAGLSKKENSKIV